MTFELNEQVDAVMGPRQTEVVHRNEDEAPAPAYIFFFDIFEVLCYLA